MTKSKEKKKKVKSCTLTPSLWGQQKDMFLKLLVKATITGTELIINNSAGVPQSRPCPARTMDLLHGSKKAKPLRKLWSRLHASSTDFAAMDVCNQFKRVFEVIDENGDGKISPSELSQVLLCLGYDESIASAEAEGMVREMDCDGDGFVDLDEFMDAVFNNSNDADSDGRSNGVDAAEEYDNHLMDAFLVFDADKNGKISAKELRKVLVRLGCDGCSIGECRRMIKGVDKNGDGFVDFEEFRLMMTKKR